MRELGEITYYVHDRRNVALVVTDDDISGTFTFVRALQDYGYRRDLTPEQIGQTWLNYIIERRTILWWGGLGLSTEHTAYLRLKRGIPAPQSGSTALNSKVVAEQIGAQIFIDGWAMVAPGDPEFAADLARRAASVSHDGEAIYGAQVIAAMESQAYVEPELNRLLDTAVSFIPRDSVIYRMIGDIRDWHAEHRDWRDTLRQIQATYGYDKYGGNCHIVPNHALIIMSLLHGDDNFQKSLMIVNTSGWDTDCNSGNVGCLLGIKNGLAAIDAGPDWRGPVADRLYLPTADGGRAITDAAAETYQLVNAGLALAGQPPVQPKNGARFHFELPGSVQGFRAEPSDRLTLQNVEGHSVYGRRSLALHYADLTTNEAVRAATPTFIPPEALDGHGSYQLLASPTLYSGQHIRAALSADAANVGGVAARLYIGVYGAQDSLSRVYGPPVVLSPRQDGALTWEVPNTGGEPIAQVGIELTTPQGSSGCVYLDFLTWDGSPTVVLGRPEPGSPDGPWRRAWVDGVDQIAVSAPEAYRVIQNEGTGLLIQGTREWTDYRVSASITPHLVESCGIAARVQGMRRYYALLLHRDGTLRLIKALDGYTTLASQPFPWEFTRTYTLSLQMGGAHLLAWVGDQLAFDVEDHDSPLLGGAVALVCEEGRMGCDAVTISAIARERRTDREHS